MKYSSHQGCFELIDRIPLQSGYRDHPQNCLPAFYPAVRLIMGPLHLGHPGIEPVVIVTEACDDVFGWADAIIAASFGPSINSIFQPDAGDVRKFV